MLKFIKHGKRIIHKNTKVLNITKLYLLVGPYINGLIAALSILLLLALNPLLIAGVVLFSFNLYNLKKARAIILLNGGNLKGYMLSINYGRFTSWLGYWNVLMFMGFISGTAWVFFLPLIFIALDHYRYAREKQNILTLNEGA